MSAESHMNSGLQHEAGDRAFVVAQHFSDFVKDHPFVSGSAELAKLAEAAENALADLYQAIWKAPTNE